MGLADDLFRIPIYRSIRLPLGYRMVARALEVSGSALRSVFGWPDDQVTERFWPSFDLCNPADVAVAGGPYDLVLADQVLEHVVDPQVAVLGLGNLLREGGIAVVTTVFMFPVHDAPQDYFRFTPEGLRRLFTGWEQVHAEGWGNPEAVELAMRWQEVNHDQAVRGVLDLPNDPFTPVVTWAWARKPVAEAPAPVRPSGSG